MEISLGKYTVRSAEELPSRLSMLLWGMPGNGKTTLAATAPGKKLWINFDPDGVSSVAGLRGQLCGKFPGSALHNEIQVIDLSSEPNKIIDEWKKDDPLKLGEFFLGEGADIDTVIVDSLTRVSQMALEHTLKTGNHGNATIEKPGKSVYGARNALLLRLIVDMLQVTGKHKKNLILITHEGAPKEDDKGIVLFTTMALGGQLPNLSSAQISEVWYISDTGRERRIAVRPVRGYKPMKSRMFNISGDKEFKWDYDIEKPNPKFEIATWYKEFIDSGGQKLQLPK